MLSCDEVRTALPGIEAGERATGEVRDHLASCVACRAEAAQLRGDLQALRGELSVLARSPLLEDAVLDRARAPIEGVGRRARRQFWLATGLGLTAACLLVAFVLAARSGDREGTTGGGGEDGAGGSSDALRVWMPPTAATLEAARRANPSDFDDSPGPSTVTMWLHAYRDAQGGVTTRTLDTIQPLDEDVTHRWVMRAGVGEKGPRAHALVGVPPRGVQILGKELIDRAGGIELLSHKEYYGGGAVSIEIEVGSPGEGGTRARVEAILRPDYTGSLLLEEPLARALGLYQFEIPGGCTVVGDVATPALRARARVRLQPSRLDPRTKELVDLPVFDEIVEVQVLAAGHPRPAPTLPEFEGGRLGLRFEGARPDRVLLAARAAALPAPDEPSQGLQVHLEGDVQVVEAAAAGKTIVEVPVGEPGPRHVLLSYESGRRPACQVWLPPLDMGGGHPGGYVFRLVRTELAGRYEPGASVVVGRAWRGGTAIPSRESVALTTVAEDGSISFVRVRGEEGGTLRMRIAGTDGKATFHEIRLPSREIVINVMADGQVHCTAYSFSLFRPPAAGEGPRPDPEALEALERLLAKLVEAQSDRDEAGRPDRAVLINAQGHVPWRVVQWILQVCASPEVGLRRMQFHVMGRDDVALRNDLPEDKGLLGDGGPRNEVARIRVVLTASEGGTRVVARWGAFRLDGVLAGASSVIEDLREAVRRQVQDVGADKLEVVVTAPPPRGGRVPYGDVHRVVQALRDAGVGQVLFEGAAVPR